MIELKNIETVSKSTLFGTILFYSVLSSLNAIIINPDIEMIVKNPTSVLCNNLHNTPAGIYLFTYCIFQLHTCVL